MKVRLVDGTYELYRQFYGSPSSRANVGAIGLLRSTLELLGDPEAEVGVATDHVIESFRNGLWDGYKTGEDMDPDLFAQLHLVEKLLPEMGITVWATTELEADDTIASVAKIVRDDSRVEVVQIYSPDKDLCQCVTGDRVVQVDRKTNQIRNEEGVFEKFGVMPWSIPDWLALVGDSSDGFPGVPGWGAKSSSQVLAGYTYLEQIPLDAANWNIKVRSAASLARALEENFANAELFKVLATLRIDPNLLHSVDDLRWKEPTKAFIEWCVDNDAQDVARRAEKLWTSRQN